MPPEKSSTMFSNLCIMWIQVSTQKVIKKSLFQEAKTCITRIHNFIVKLVGNFQVPQN